MGCLHILPRPTCPCYLSSTESQCVCSLASHTTNWLGCAQVLFEAAPVMWLQPKPLDEINPPPGYSCPVYRTAGKHFPHTRQQPTKSDTPLLAISIDVIKLITEHEEKSE
eukprot:scaffold233212_cov17-Tisochrysis_lutea.AAC.2